MTNDLIGKAHWAGQARPSRREVLAGAGAGGLALALSARRAFAAGAENVLKIGFISPRTGALGRLRTRPTAMCSNSRARRWLPAA